MNSVISASDRWSLHIAILRRRIGPVLLCALALGALHLPIHGELIVSATASFDANEVEASRILDNAAVGFTGQTVVLVNEAPLLSPPVEYTIPVFGEDVKSATDRLHEWNSVSVGLPLPEFLVGGEYLMVPNDAKWLASWQLQVTLSRPARVYLLLDNRLGDEDAATPPDTAAGAPWVSAANGWAPLITGANRAGNLAIPDEVGVDELTGPGLGTGPGESVDNYASVYYKDVCDGSVTLFALDQSQFRNMYSLVVTELVTEDSIVIDGCDTGVLVPNGLGCTISLEISQCAAAADDHGAFVSCVARLTTRWLKVGVLSKADRGRIQSCAAQSGLPAQ